MYFQRLVIILLLSLLSASVARAQPGSSRGQKSSSDYYRMSNLAGFRSQIDELVGQLEAGQDISEQLIQIPNVTFSTASAELKPDMKRMLDILVPFLRRASNADIIVTGHTDERGSAEYNEQLSRERAQAVRNYLLQELGYDEDRIETRYYGEWKPLANRTSAEALARNRRVEFTIKAEDYIQDLLILCAGDTLGVRINEIKEDVITYQGFGNDDIREIPTTDVCQIDTNRTKKVIVRDTVEVMQRDTVKVVDTVEVEKIDTLYMDGPPPMPPMCAPVFSQGFGFLMGGGEFFNNIFEIYQGAGAAGGSPFIRNQTFAFPPISLTYDYGLTCQIGVGLTLAGRFWQSDLANLVYYSASPRVTYHPNMTRWGFMPDWLVNHVDLYAGLTGSYRSVYGNRIGSDFDFTTDNFTVNLLAGLRVKAGDRWGFYLEGSADAIAHMRAGAYFVIHRPKAQEEDEQEEEPLSGETPDNVDNK